MKWKVRLWKPLCMRCLVTVMAFALSEAIWNTHDREDLREGASAVAALRLDVLEGEQTSLPCRVHVAAQRAVSVTWYQFSASGKNKYNENSSQNSNIHQEAKQVYAVVAPTSPTPVLAGSAGLVDGTHWKQPQWAGRAFFSLLSDPPALLLNRLEHGDTGNYVCNVTYRDDDNNTTLSITITEAVIELLVAVPLPSPVIMDDKGAVLGQMAGPYAEGDTLRLKCVAASAEDKVILEWRRNGEQVNHPIATVESSDGGFESTLDIGPLLRKDLFSNISCVATSGASRPVDSTVTLDMFLAPMDVVLRSWPHGKNDASGLVMMAASAPARSPNAAMYPPKPLTLVSAEKPEGSGKAASHFLSTVSQPITTVSRDDLDAGSRAPTSFECEVNGSRPHATIRWFLDGRLLDDSLSQSRSEGNVTASVLLLPTSEHSGNELECRASNSFLPEDRGVVGRYLALNSSNKPEVNIELGAGLNASHITEGADVYMECSVVTASRIPDVTWSHDGREVGAEPAEGRVVTSRYLVFRRVDPRHSGSYTCTATRSGGEKVESKPLHIRIQYSPRCDGPEEHTVRVEKYEAINVTCNLRADPKEGLRYFWLPVNGTEILTMLNNSWQPSRGSLLHRPLVTSSDRLEITVNASLFKTVLACWAENAVGMQRKQCRFKFTDTSNRSSGLTCRVGNYTDTSFSLTCWRHLGNDTQTTAFWQQQRLRVEVLDRERGNRSERSFWSRGIGPMFVTRLRPSTEYLVVVWMPPDASFRTYIRTLAPAHILLGQEGFQTTLTRRTWTLIFTAVVLTCCLLVTLGTLVCVYCACVQERPSRKPRRPPDRADDSGAACMEQKSEHVGDKIYLSSIGIS